MISDVLWQLIPSNNGFSLKKYLKLEGIKKSLVSKDCEKFKKFLIARIGSLKEVLTEIKNTGSIYGKKSYDQNYKW